MNERPHLENTVRQDPRYREGLAHMQAARWAKAIESFLLLTRDYPESVLAARALEEAQFKSELDARNTIKAKPANAIDVRKWAMRLVLVVLLGVIVWQGVPFVTGTVLPYIRLQRLTSQVNELVVAGNTALKAENLDAAEGSYAQVVSLAGAYPVGEGQASPFSRQVSVAEDGLAQIAIHREVIALYEEGVKYQEQSRIREALEVLKEVSRRWPGFQDVDERIAQIEGQVSLEDMLTDGEALRQAGLYVESLAVYQEIQRTSLSFRRELVTSRLYELYVAAGKQLLRTWFPDRDIRDVYAEAQGYFKEALTLQPKSEEVAAEQRLVAEYEAAEGLYFEARWAEAVEALGAVYDVAPDYVGGHLAELLYDALIHRADELREAGDTYEAYALYQRAASLPVPDRTMAQGGMAAIDALFLPTPTPGPTATQAPQTPTPRPTRRPASGPTAVPTGVPLSTYRGKIVFFSDKPGESGVWVMNGDGSGRQYLGSSQELYAQHAQLVATYRYGGGGRAYVHRNPEGPEAFPQVWVSAADGERQLTHHAGYCYDPAWSPDGRRIVYVGQGLSSSALSDDIWVINADGTGEEPLTPWDKTYEKHPSWSPDGSQIVFWSSRAGPQQIHVMTTFGENVRNISNTSWNEYDPVWVR